MVFVQKSSGMGKVVGMGLNAETFPGENHGHSRVVRVELTVRIGTETFKTENWSMGGFLLDDYVGPLSTGALVTVAGLGRMPRNMRSVELPARVVRTGEHAIVVNYLSLDANAYEFLQRAMSDSGEMRVLLGQDFYAQRA